MTISLRHYAREAQHGSQDAMIYILEQFEPLIKKQARRYQHNYQSFEEAKSSIHHAAIHCVMTFDLTKPQTVQQVLPNRISSLLHQEDYRRKKYQKYVQKTFVNDKETTDLPKECLAPVSSCPENSYLRVSRTKRLKEALETLSERERTFIRLYYAHGYTHTKIGNIYHLDESYVRRILRKALQTLRMHLQEEKALMFD